ncbi:hypothetical protein V2J09_019192 [Rumex salicifolius]
MAMCPPNDVVSSVFHRSSSTHRQWTSSFLRTIINSFRCGVRSSSRRGRSSRIALSSSPAKPPLSAYSESGSVKLVDLFKMSSHPQAKSEDCGALTTTPFKKVEKFDEISQAVRLLQRDGVEERRDGAKLVRRLAKEDGDVRVILAKLGAIPPLLEMLDDDDQIRDEIRVEALYALLNLGIGNDLNKAAIVQAGALHKMLKMTRSPDSSISEAIAANLLALSASDSNKPIIGSSGAIPFLVSILKEPDSKHSSQSKQDSFRAIYNLSILPSNIPSILENDLTCFLMNSMGDTEHTERILSILCNATAVPEGRKAISAVPDAFPTLIDVLSWNDSPGCQERASYVLMVMAHKSYNDRHKMIESGIGSALLELTLIGSTLAQKRASRILECLRVDKGKSVRDFGFSAISAPINREHSSSMRVETDGAISKERRAVRRLVQQSLQSNMRKIVRRANLPQDFVPSDHLKALTSSSTSRSLPF